MEDLSFNYKCFKTEFFKIYNENTNILLELSITNIFK